MSWALVFWYAGVFIRNGQTDGGKAFTAIFSAIVGGMYAPLPHVFIICNSFALPMVSIFFECLLSKKTSRAVALANHSSVCMHFWSHLLYIYSTS